MTSKKERLEFLEAECETHRESLKELFDKVRELEQKLNGKVNSQPGNVIQSVCPNCGTLFQGTHFCWCVPTTRTYPPINPYPNGWRSVITTSTTTKI